MDGELLDPLPLRVDCPPLREAACSLFKDCRSAPPRDAAAALATPPLIATTTSTLSATPPRGAAAAAILSATPPRNATATPSEAPPCSATAATFAMPPPAATTELPKRYGAAKGDRLGMPLCGGLLVIRWGCRQQRPGDTRLPLAVGRDTRLRCPRAKMRRGHRGLFEGGEVRQRERGKVQGGSRR